MCLVKHTTEMCYFHCVCFDVVTKRFRYEENAFNISRYPSCLWRCWNCHILLSVHRSEHCVTQIHSNWTTDYQSINQSINQSELLLKKFYCANIPSEGQTQWCTKQIGVQKPKSRIWSRNVSRQDQLSSVMLCCGSWTQTDLWITQRVEQNVDACN